MAKIILNKKGFKIIGLTPDECKDIGFGFQYIDKLKDANNYCWDLICDNCNNIINSEVEVYYIPVLNRIFCKDCLVDWYKTATNYPEDKHYEDKKYANLLAMFESNKITITERVDNIL